jgi:hypothetical protein
MADYTSPKTIVPGAEALASDWNTYIRDNTINLNDRIESFEDGIDGTQITSGTISGDRLPAGVALPIVNSSTSSTLTLDFSTGNELIRSTREGTLTIGGINYAAGVSKTVIWNGGTANRTVQFPANWIFVSFEPTQLDANKRGVLTVTCFGTAEGDCTAAWAAEI